MSDAVRLVLAWQLLVELSRRHAELWLIEAHPGGGQYDCLWLYRASEQGSGKHVVSLNRHGSVQVEPWWHQSDSGWGELAMRGPYGMARRLGPACGLTVSPSPGRWTRRTVTYGAIGMVLARQLATVRAGEVGDWDVRNGVLDTSDLGGGVRRPWFDAFRGLADRLAMPHPHDPLKEPGYRFWFLLHRKEPVLAFETNGTAVLPSGTVIDLFGRMKGQSGDLVPVVQELVARLPG